MNDQQSTPPTNAGANNSKAFEMPKSVSIKSLTEKLGDSSKASEVYHKICNIGGFGSFGKNFHGGFPSLDLSGISDTDKMSQIEKLLK